jgi:hypothetical protein
VLNVVSIFYVFMLSCFCLDEHAHLDVKLDLNSTELLEVLNWSPSQPIAPDRSNYWQGTQQDLRKYVDAWLRSGLRPDGSEAPNERCVDRVVSVALDPEHNFDELMFANSFSSFAHAHALKITLPNGAGNPVVQLVLKELGPGQSANQRATSLIVALVLSDLRYRIAKCRYEKCNRYFFLKEKAQKKIYVRGLFCSLNCNRAANAARLTKIRRGDFKPTVVEWAADFLRQNEIEPRDDEAAKSEMLPKLNARIGKNKNLAATRKLNHDGTYIAVNWLSRHWEEIQAREKEMDTVKPETP